MPSRIITYAHRYKRPPRKKAKAAAIDGPAIVRRHMMIVGAAAKTMGGYSRTTDPDPTKPYVMWPGSPHEHLMIPVK